MNGILESKSSIITTLLIAIILTSGCKEKVSQTEKSALPSFRTNIRFATKTDNYKEKSSFDRLTTDKSEVTSTQFQMEGPAWENEFVAFRNYFDARNGIDIFGKRKTDMVLDAVGIDENYHELQDWGTDILKVGNSLGAGAIGMIINDSLYRIATGANGSFKIIDESPESSTIEFTFQNWQVQKRKYNVSHKINIKSGTHFYEGTVIVDGLRGDETIVAGIVDHGVGASIYKSGDYTVLSTHGNQDVEGKVLGMAIATKTLEKTAKASDYSGAVDKTHLALLNRNSLQYNFFVGWELQDEGFKSEKYFKQMVQQELSDR